MNVFLIYHKTNMKKLPLLIALLFIFFNKAASQDQIYLHPDQVDHLNVFGSNNVVIRGESVTIKPKSISEKVRKRIEENFQT